MVALILATITGAALGSISGHAAEGAAVGAGLVVLGWLLGVLEWLLKFLAETWPVWLVLTIVFYASTNGR